ncbi:hypothetical protein Aperf_G00000029608 [Anoplocephala perfoliata]
MLIFLTYFTFLLVIPFVCSKATNGAAAPVNVASGFFVSKSAVNDRFKQGFQFQKQNPMVQCIGVLRGILLTAGVHTGRRIEAIVQCPENTDSKLANLCSADNYAFPEEVGSVKQLQEELLSKLKSGNSSDLGEHLNLVIRKVSPVVDSSSGLIYANSYCASCHNVKPTKLSRKLFCVGVTDGVGRCFVGAKLPDNVKICEVEREDPQISTHFSSQFSAEFSAHFSPQFSPQFLFDSIFTLPEDIEESNEDAEASIEEKIFEICQWICCIFSFLTLILAICVFSTSPRLRQALPGKMMIALCCALLGSVIAFLLASGVMGVIATPVRPLCVTVAWLFLLFLLSSFVWMVMFAVELFRTFGLVQLFRQIFRCHQCRNDQNRKANATSLMLRSRESDSNPLTRFKLQLILSLAIPLCFGIPALAINEYVYHRIEPMYNASIGMKWSQSTEEAELGSSLYRVYPRFCPLTNPNYAWFSGDYHALMTWFLLPAGTMICFNLLALIIVCIQIYRLKRETGLSPSTVGPQQRPSNSLIAVCSKLAVILGASWFIQLLAGLCPHLVIIRKVAGLMNSAQGGIIALSMLTGSKARRVMARRLPKRWQEALGFSEVTSTSKQEVITKSTSRSLITGQTNSSQTTSLIQSV